MTKDTKKRPSRDDVRRQFGRAKLESLLKRGAKKKADTPLPDVRPPQSAEVVDRLATAIGTNRDALPQAGHSGRLLARGLPQVGQKLGEEAIECVIALLGGDKGEIVGESADVLYHLFVAWSAADVQPSEVWAELERREELSKVIGHDRAFSKDALRQVLGTSKVPI